MESITALHILTHELPVILGIVVLLFMCGVLYRHLFLYSAILLFVMALFIVRNPVRTNAAIYQDLILLAPVDGKVISIYESFDDMGDMPVYIITIRSSFFDVHMHRAVCSGVVSKDSLDSRTVTICSKQGKCCIVKQIDEKWIRNTINWLDEKKQLQAGQLYGMSIIGGTFEIIVPREVLVQVGVGQHVMAGITLLGYLKNA